MGSGLGNPEALENERPAHRLYLPEFQIARTQVTNVQYLHYERPRYETSEDPPCAN